MPEGVFDAILFDMDGTLLDSSAVTKRVWRRWAIQHNRNAEDVIAMLHGRRAIDTLLALGLDPTEAEREANALNLQEESDMDGVIALPGAQQFLAMLPASRWAIVTSSTTVLAERRLHAAGLPIPGVLVTCEDVMEGKPSPQGFRSAALRLGVNILGCLVFEDSPAGIAAGHAAGAKVCGVGVAPEEDYWVEDYHGLSAEYFGTKIWIRSSS
ncbi:HAD-IA family hydrolase [Devosia submarina]|uniref:HAD-IA family hydrolase n=1 Tax=Devosia submarina TaxID=1173082 RepID=UPI000D34F957|nr:HAD-IA family hydrolase [Devosia submarina]